MSFWISLELLFVAVVAGFIKLPSLSCYDLFYNRFSEPFEICFDYDKTKTFYISIFSEVNSQISVMYAFSNSYIASMQEEFGFEVHKVPSIR